MKGDEEIRKRLATLPRLVTLKQAAAELGVPVWSVRRAMWDGDLPQVRIGRTIRIDRHDLEAWLTRQKIRGPAFEYGVVFSSKERMMSSSLDIRQELDALDKASGLEEKLQATISKHSARLAAAVQLENTKTMAAASKMLSESIETFTAASNRATKELARWTEATATWTRRLTLATNALFVVAVAQVLVMWFGKR